MNRSGQELVDKLRHDEDKVRKIAVPSFHILLAELR